MLEDGYLEIIGIVDPALYDNELGRFLARYHGIHIMALGVADAASQVARLREAGLATPGVRPMRRNVAMPTGEAEVRFKRVPLADAPEGRIQLIEHETPELMWQDHLLDHPNRVVALMETVLCVADVASAEDRYRRLTGIVPLRRGGARIFAFASGRLVLCDPASLGDFVAPEFIVPEFTTDAFVDNGAPPTLPWFAGFSVATDDGNVSVRRILRTNGVAHAEHGGALVVRAEAAAGAVCRFLPHPPSPRRARNATLATASRRGRP